MELIVNFFILFLYGIHLSVVGITFLLIPRKRFSCSLRPIVTLADSATSCFAPPFCDLSLGPRISPEIHCERHGCLLSG